MRSTRRRIAEVLLVIPPALALIGCDNDPAVIERRAGQDIVAARLHASAGTLPAAEKSRTDLNNIANTAGESLGTKALAKAAAADAAQIAANLHLAEVSRARAELNRVVQDLRVLTAQLRSLGTTAAGTTARDPKRVVDGITGELIPAARGDGNRADWLAFESGMKGLPTLATVSQRKSQIESEIARRNEQIAQLESQRSSLIEQANERLRISESSKGQESVDAFRQSADLRENAEGLSSQIMLVQAEIIPFQADLALAEQQEATINAGIAALEARRGQIAQTWQSDTQALAAIEQAGTALISGGGEGAFTLEAKLNEYKAAREALDEAYAAAEAALKNAVEDLAAAVTSADQLARGAGTFTDANSPEAKAFALLRDSGVNAVAYRVRQAHVLNHLAIAQLAASTEAARTLAEMQSLTALAGGDSPLPTSLRDRIRSLTAGLVDQLTKASTSLGEAGLASQQEASTLLSGVIDGASRDQALRNAARASNVLVTYTPVLAEHTLVVDKANPARALEQAARAASAARQDQVRLPILPPRLQAAMGSVPSTPVESPSETPETPATPDAPVEQ